MTAQIGLQPPARLVGIRAITFDFGNTLVQVGRDALHQVTERVATDVSAALGLGDRAAFRTAWAEERDRQFREEVPVFREVDLYQRAIRIMARLRGMPTPPAEERWDDDGAARFSAPDEIDTVVEAYSRAFVATMPPVVGAGEVLAGLAARGFRLAILSNWPLAATVDRYAASAGWDRHLVGIFVSQRIGTIKPHPAIFEFAAHALGHAPHEILHVGDDWAADVVGARNAGWRVAYLRDHQADTPLPVSYRTAEIVPDLDLERLADLPSRITDPTA